MQADAPTIAVVGATGAVGREALRLLAARAHPRGRVLAFASERSTGKTIPYDESGSVEVLPLEIDALSVARLVILAASADLARRLAPELTARGCRVVDNSSFFRLHADVPLVIPEVNPSLIRPGTRLVANPNCSTILLLVALEPLRRAFGVERVVVSTYQAVSGAGLGAIRELRDQTRSVLDGLPPRPRMFPEPCAFNVFPHESPVDPESGLNEEERKLVRETGRIWRGAEARIVPTCARVPVERSHCQSVVVTLRHGASEEQVRSALSVGAGIEVLDDRTSRTFPTSLRASGTDRVLVGRVRPELNQRTASGGRARTFCLWLAGDQLRKGAALNALQIGDLLLRGSDGHAHRVNALEDEYPAVGRTCARDDPGSSQPNRSARAQRPTPSCQSDA